MLYQLIIPFGVITKVIGINCLEMPIHVQRSVVSATNKPTVNAQPRTTPVLQSLQCLTNLSRRSMHFPRTQSGHSAWLPPTDREPAR